MKSGNLLDFASANSRLRQLIVARELVKDRLSESSISAAFDIVGCKAHTGTNEERLEAVSLLGKASEISSPVAKVVKPLLEKALVVPLPGIGSWGVADDRYYLAKALSWSDQAWITRYAAIELARADISERSSRDIWAEIVVNRAPNLSDALHTVVDALADDKRLEGYTVDTACRKLNRILVALRDPISLSETDIGDRFGEAFADLISRASDHRGPTSSKLREQVASSIFDFMAQVLRLQSAIAFDSQIFRAVSTVVGWWKPATPPTSTNALTQRILTIAMKQLHLLARLGHPEKTLREAIVSAFGADRVNRLGHSIASNDPSLDPSMAWWLSTGTELPDAASNPNVRETTERTLDGLVANLLLAVEQKEGGPEALELLADEFELLEPRSAKTIRTGATRSRLVRQWAQAIGESRGLALSGNRGALVEYDPAIHQSSQNPPVSTRVRIQTPAVLKTSGNRPTTVVVKAFVERL